MVETLTFRGRLPGVVVETLPPQVEEPLRMDVAGFVGFAERGPLDTPTALEDLSQYRAVFGGDVPPELGVRPRSFRGSGRRTRVIRKRWLGCTAPESAANASAAWRVGTSGSTCAVTCTSPWP